MPANTDSGGLNDGEESMLGTSPVAVDTDGDGLTDFEETGIAPFSDPLNAWSLSQAQGWGNLYTDWQMADLTDTDGDGIPDRIELAFGLNPHDPADAGGDLDGTGR